MTTETAEAAAARLAALREQREAHQAALARVGQERAPLEVALEEAQAVYDEAGRVWGLALGATVEGSATWTPATPAEEAARRTAQREAEAVFRAAEAVLQAALIARNDCAGRESDLAMRVRFLEQQIAQEEAAGERREREQAAGFALLQGLKRGLGQG